MKTLKCYLLLSICLLYGATIFAQTFEDIIGTKNNFEVGVCATTDVSGNLLAGGYMIVKDFGSLPLLLKFNSDGALDSKLTIPEFVNIPHINLADIEAVHDADGKANGYILVFQYAFDVVIARFNNYDNLVWAKKIYRVLPREGKVVQAAYSPVTHKLNGFYLSVEGGGYYRLLKLGDDGTIKWQKRIDYPNKQDAFFISDIIADDEDGGCLVVGNLRTEDIRPVVLKFSPYGRLLWGKRYDFPGSFDGASVSAAAATNGGYILSGQESKNSLSPNFTMKISRTGEVVWANDYSIPYIYNDPHNLITDSSGNIIFGGPYEYNPLFYYPDTTRKAFLVKLDSAGNIVFGKRYHNRMLINDVALTPDGGYYAVGHTDFQYDIKPPPQLYAIRTDANGNIANSCKPVLNLPFKRTTTQVEIAKKADYVITDDTLTLTDITGLTTKKLFQGFPIDSCGTTASSAGNKSKLLPVNHIIISPNPSNGTFTLSYSNLTANPQSPVNMQINVYDKTGKLMFTKTEHAIKGNNTYQLNLSHLINGIYNLQVINGNMQQQAKFVIEK